VNVKARVAVVAHRNVADRAQDFALFGDLYFLVSLPLDIVAFSKEPIAVRDAAVSPASFANFVSAANASSPDSNIATRRQLFSCFS
jgi:hypothetical protein